MTPELKQHLLQTDANRRAGNWTDALRGYQVVLKLLPDDPVIEHNLGLCYLALGDGLMAEKHSLKAFQLQPQQWQSALIHAKSLIENGKKNEALVLLEELALVHTSSAEIIIDLAKLLMQHGGDAARACTLVAPFLHTKHHRDAESILLISQLYDRDKHVDAAALSDALCRFSDVYLQLPTSDSAMVADHRPFYTTPALTNNANRRLKVGLLSPQFSVSPVYFFTFGALQLMSGDVDFVFFSRGKKSDWATLAFQSIALDWVDVSLCSSEQLATVLASHGLDVLMDLGGWMDPIGLQALSVKPAKKMFKWVGGQSATTGLRCFDGYLTDRYQTPKGFDRYFSEPLIRLQSGYVTYTPPPYLPEPLKRSGQDVSLGVIANPAKLSRAFLAELSQMMAAWAAERKPGDRVVRLHLIDKRYAQEGIRQRIWSALPDVNVRFVTPVSHLAYLNAVRGLDATLDTWPYSGGLTTIEALALGVPSFTRFGELFCERHTVSHCYFSGLKLGACDVNKLLKLNFPDGAKKSLLAHQSPRTNHDALARELLFCLHVV